MKRFRNVLVIAPPDIDATATLEAADRLAAANDAEVTVFDTVPLVALRDSALPGYSDETVRGLLENARRAELDELVGQATTRPFEVDVATGTLFLEAIRRVIAHDHDLVMLPPDGVRGSSGLVRASTTMHMLRKCPVPVWVHRPDSTRRGDVLSAVGPFDEGVPSLLDRKLVELGSSLADRQGGRFHLVHVWNLRGESLLRNGRVRIPAADVDRFVVEAELTARSGVDKLLADSGLAAGDVTVHLLKGDPASTVAALTSEIRPEVVVMGTLARGGIAGLLIGNTAESVLGSLEGSVLAVKPNGFVSPVSL